MKVKHKENINVKHLTEEQLDRYINSKSDFSKRELTLLEHHLRHCDACRGIYNWLDEFYGIVHESAAYIKKDYIHALSTANQSSSHFCELLPCNFHLDNDNEGELIILAADSLEEQKRFEQAAAYKTENKNVVLKIIRDNHQNHYRLYILGDSSLLEHRILLYIENINTTVIANSKGQAIIESPEYTEDICQQLGRIYLHIPKIALNLSMQDNRDSNIAHANEQLQIFGFHIKRNNRNTIELIIENNNSVTSHMTNYLVTESVSGTKVFTQDEFLSSNSFSLGSSTEDIAIYIYN